MIAQYGGGEVDEDDCLLLVAEWNPGIPSASAIGHDIDAESLLVLADEWVAHELLLL